MDGICKWIFGWKAADKKPVKSAELWWGPEEAHNRNQVTLR
jgi:ribonuclease HI